VGGVLNGKGVGWVIIQFTDWCPVTCSLARARLWGCGKEISGQPPREVKRYSTNGRPIFRGEDAQSGGQTGYLQEISLEPLSQVESPNNFPRLTVSFQRRTQLRGHETKLCVELTSLAHHGKKEKDCFCRGNERLFLWAIILK